MTDEQQIAKFCTHLKEDGRMRASAILTIKTTSASRSDLGEIVHVCPICSGRVVLLLNALEFGLPAGELPT